MPPDGNHVPRLVSAALLGICSLAVPGPAHAQADSLHQLIDALTGEAQVRVELQERTPPLVGTIESRRAGQVTLRTTSTTHWIETTRLKRLWSQDGNHAERGFLIGALVGGTVAGVAGAVLEAPFRTEGAILWGAGGALVGGGIGYLYGRRQPRWQLHYSVGPQGVTLRLPVP